MDVFGIACLVIGVICIVFGFMQIVTKKMYLRKNVDTENEKSRAFAPIDGAFQIVIGIGIILLGLGYSEILDLWASYAGAALVAVGALGGWKAAVNFFGTNKDKKKKKK